MGSITVSKTEVSLCNVAAYNVVSFLRSEIVDLKGKKKERKKKKNLLLDSDWRSFRSQMAGSTTAIMSVF